MACKLVVVLTAIITPADPLLRINTQEIAMLSDAINSVLEHHADEMEGFDAVG